MTCDAGAAHDAHGFVQRLDGALARANETIHSEGTREQRYRGMGTTATLVGLRDGFAYVAQVGDSRAYLVRGRSITRLTRDQSLVQDLVDMGVLTEEDARTAPNNQILQALGVSPTVRPALTYQELRKDDVLLLCSDGLSKVVRDEEVQAAAASAADCAALCDDLVALANARGGPDNITLLVARVGGDGIDGPRDGDLVQRREYRQATG
jgi:protein phosphatase